MARYRSIQTSFWQDNFIVKLPLIEKSFYSYILTNSRTNQCGIYNFSIIFSAIELGCSEEGIRELINKFVQYGKILYGTENEEIMILNWYKYNLNTSRNTLICVNRELEDLKDWCSKLNEDIVIMAIDEAVRNNARNIKYLNGILINWHSEGLKGVEDVKLFMKSWQEKSSKKLRVNEEQNNAGAYKVVAEVGTNGEE